MYKNKIKSKKSRDNQTLSDGCRKIAEIYQNYMKKTGMPPICAASRFSYNTMNPCFFLKNVPWHILAPRAVACDNLHLRVSAHLWNSSEFPVT